MRTPCAHEKPKPPLTQRNATFQHMAQHKDSTCNPRNIGA